MMKNYDNKPSSSAAAAALDERISVVKLSKSGGCVDRDAAFMKAVRESQIRTYFFGNPVPSTASAALSISSSSTTNVTLSPHAQQLDFNSLSLYNYTTSSADDDQNDDDDYDPAQLTTGESFLPGDNEAENASSLPGTNPATNERSSGTAVGNSLVPLKKVLPPAPSALANTLLAITHCPPTSSPGEIRDASTMGFLYVADVDSERGKIRVLAPAGGRLPSRAIVWGKKWPAEVVGLVG